LASRQSLSRFDEKAERLAVVMAALYPFDQFRFDFGGFAMCFD
jgi:hypothetical protein